jgi:hypothetical protein
MGHPPAVGPPPRSGWAAPCTLASCAPPLPGSGAAGRWCAARSAPPPPCWARRCPSLHSVDSTAQHGVSTPRRTAARRGREGARKDVSAPAQRCCPAGPARRAARAAMCGTAHVQHATALWLTRVRGGTHQPSYFTLTIRMAEKLEWNPQCHVSTCEKHKRRPGQQAPQQATSQAVGPLPPPPLTPRPAPPAHL